MKTLLVTISLLLGLTVIAADETKPAVDESSQPAQPAQPTSETGAATEPAPAADRGFACVNPNEPASNCKIPPGATGTEGTSVGVEGYHELKHQPLVVRGNTSTIARPDSGPSQPVSTPSTQPARDSK